MTHTPHLTTRRGFIAAAGFGGTALYGLWVGYGAAPGPLALFGAEHSDAPAPDVHDPQADLTPDAFEDRVQDFVHRFGQADGSVRPQADDAHDTAHAGHGGHAAHGGAVQDGHGPAAPVDIWLHAAQFFFEPSHLRLQTKQPYRFRMMATDVTHGASIQFGRGGRMIRLRPGQLVTTTMTFPQPGTYLITCTSYCGTAHDAMQARLSVAEGGAA